MNTRPPFIVASLALILMPLAPLAAREEPSATPLLPARSTWKLTWDTTLDGKLSSDLPAVSWQVDVCNNRIHVAGGGSVLAGEIIEGKSPVFNLRQDDTKGYVTIYSGKLTDRKFIIGTWFNTFGHSGDFKLSIEN